MLEDKKEKFLHPLCFCSSNYLQLLLMDVGFMHKHTIVRDIEQFLEQFRNPLQKITLVTSVLIKFLTKAVKFDIKLKLSR